MNTKPVIRLNNAITNIRGALAALDTAENILKDINLTTAAEDLNCLVTDIELELCQLIAISKMWLKGNTGNSI